jgi:hypothetical protein
MNTNQQQQISTIESVARRFSKFCDGLIENAQRSDKPVTMDKASDAELENIISTLRAAVPKLTSTVQIVVDSKFIGGLADALTNGLDNKIKIEQRDSNQLIPNQNIVLFAFNGNVRLATYVNEANTDYYNVVQSKPKQIVLLPIHLNRQTNVEKTFKNMQVINFWSNPVFSKGPKLANLKDSDNHALNDVSFEELKKLFHAQIICNYCESTNNELLKCSACMNAFYCNVSCQYSDWNNHATYCGKNKE